ncbi:hypothetical protein ElP_71720 (plasmid) [Tautonia plasticadhaerens]|uniref:Uncharacterized protein n=2 Tax=Tautonia plasticadhaerens TaxID=2527974 RepID=A0A518HEE0_9BACT|nr:hypothetical protein ElP_71720 [Tautonia plasticadhaerens]
MWRIYEDAVQQLDREAQEYVRLHITAELSLEETARRIGVSRSYLRRYGGGRLAALVRDAITRMVLQMTPEDLAGIVHAMDSLGLLNEEEMSRLLCVPVEVVVDSQRGRVDRLQRGGKPVGLCRAG